MNKKLFRNTAILFFIIGILNYLGNKLYLYWTTWWHDMILHSISGFVVAMSTVLIYQIFFRRFNFFRDNVVTVSVLATLIVGLSWEYFELHFEITNLKDGLSFWTDTISDIVLDVLGGYFGVRYSLYISKNE